MKYSCMLNNVVIFCKATSEKVAAFYLLQLSSELKVKCGQLTSIKWVVPISWTTTFYTSQMIDHRVASLSKQHYWYQCVAIPGHTWACAHEKFPGAMLKAKVKDQLLACAVAFMWTHTGKTERMVFVAKNGLRSDLRLYNISWWECTPVL